LTYKLLLADDSVTIQRVIELTFAEEDVKVTTVGDGQAAIDRLESDPPDIVLADVDMPKRDGYEVAAYVKSRPKLAHIPVVLLTGAFEPIDQARAEAAGSSDVLAKPFEPQMVINRVKQLLGRKRDDEMEVPSPQSFAPPAPPQGQPAPQTPQSLKAPAVPRPPARSSMAMNDDHASQQNQPARPAPGQAAGQQPVSLDDYFDQLDAAFSNLQQPGSPAAQNGAMQAEEDWMDSQPLDQQAAPFEPLITPPPGSVNSEWMEDPPLVVAPPPPPPPPPPAPLPRPVPPSVPPPVVAKPAPPPPVPVRPVPPLAPPRPVQAAPPAPPAYVPPPRPAPAPLPAPPARAAVSPFAELSVAKPEAATRPAAPVITDEVIEEVVSRVLLRLSDRVVRETVTEIVAKTAERLVQDEIQRIKAEGQ
jgi:CheY-like chemotaxis protein